MAVGAVINAVAYLAAVSLDLATWLVLAINTVIGIGVGLRHAAMPRLIMQAVPVLETGATNGLNTVMRSLGTSVASAVVAGVLAGDASLPSRPGPRVHHQEYTKDTTGG